MQDMEDDSLTTPSPIRSNAPVRIIHLCSSKRCYPAGTKSSHVCCDKDGDRSRLRHSLLHPTRQVRVPDQSQHGCLSSCTLSGSLIVLCRYHSTGYWSPVASE
uniref:Uncharacterized protein n=1 Tax=Cacopsylla melanoneura TaxID=428564 RepID=A0A8D8WZR3_9HEMI